MALVKCSSCGAEISDAAPYCPHCGAPRIQTTPTNNSHVPGSVQNFTHVQPRETESNTLGLLSIVLGALYIVSEIIIAIYWRYWRYRAEQGNYEDPHTITIVYRLVTFILLVGFICMWCFSYKKEKDQKLRMIGTLIIAVAPIVNVILNMLLG